MKINRRQLSKIIKKNILLENYPLNAKEGNKFRGWVNDTYADYAKKIDLDRTGKLNSYLKKAWDELGDKYTKFKERRRYHESIKAKEPFILHT